MEYRPGDIVYLADSVQEDIGMLAWAYVNANRKAVILDVLQYPDDTDDSRKQYAVEFAGTFPGGHNCWGVAKPGQGQFVMAKHLSLAFEDSRNDIVTVPHIQVEPDFHL